jgi:hypothetical protein
MRWLGRWFGSNRGRPVHVVHYTRAGCHLCVEAGQVLAKYQRQFHLTLDVVDVDTSPDLVARFGLVVPAVVVDGRVRFRGRVNEALLVRLLSVTGRPTAPPDHGQDGGGSAAPS